MVTSSGFFSTLAQISSALFGFIITITVALHQLEIRERRNRTEELRSSLLKTRNKYENLMFEIVEMIELPFNKSFEPSNYDVSVDELSVDEIRNLSNEKFERPICSKISMLSYKCRSILNNISPSIQSKKDNLISKQEITELQSASEYIADITSNPDGSLINEVETKSDHENVNLSDDIFVENQETKYKNTSEWIDSHIDSENGNSNLTGDNLISISNIFKEFEDDLKDVSAKSENTILDDDVWYSHLPNFTIPFLFFGIVLPLLALINPPFDVLVLSGHILTIYQVFLAGITSIFAYLMIKSISNQ
ncbi:hypothetical protein [Haloarcula salina]|uniref:Uncharacterized protein n=1 Tax=Haloarcula salina TaxID=1429914 RepID=A0AA41KHA7_9EURY|nr:hypothetical protein [Haloarcula salina]MBV0903912.1 hypothetical protein [Haloarcula salina]